MLAKHIHMCRTCHAEHIRAWAEKVVWEITWPRLQDIYLIAKLVNATWLFAWIIWPQL